MYSGKRYEDLRPISTGIVIVPSCFKKGKGAVNLQQAEAAMLHCHCIIKFITHNRNYGSVFDCWRGEAAAATPFSLQMNKVHTNPDVQMASLNKHRHQQTSSNFPLICVILS